MDTVSLQNRIDRKYILHLKQLPQILNGIIDDYFVLEIDEKRVFSYKTVYFDTPNCQFFKDHHNGLTNRIKVRCRQYIETNDTFFEIKRKYQGTRTDKFRKPIDNMMFDLGSAEYDQIKARYAKHEVNKLNVTLQNFFYRITLVSKKLNERVTVDYNVGFSSGEKKAQLTDIAIIEVKQGKYNDASPVVQLLKKVRIFSGSISKYSYGMLLVGDSMKYNAFKPLMNRVTKIQNNGNIGFGT